MNYLAHLHLGGPLPEQLLGSLYGDFVKGRLEGRFSAPLEAGIRLHRQIDAFTDSHPLVLAAIGRFPAERRRYAGIIVDVFSITAWRGTGRIIHSSRWRTSHATSIACWPPKPTCPDGWRPWRHT